MGKRSDKETLAAIYQALLRHRTLSQAELASQIGLKVPALRRHLLALKELGMPLHDEREHPHVYWSVPRDWFPGGLAIDAGEMGGLLFLLARLPRSDARNGWIERLLRASTRRDAAPDPTPHVLPPATSDAEESYLPVVEEAAARRIPLHLRYLSASRGAIAWRHASVQRVVVGPPARLIVLCHRDDTLKWFRVDNILAAQLDERERFRPRPAGEIEEVLKASLDGFHQRESPVRSAFLVRDPEARWVRRNLPGPEMRVTDLEGGAIRVEATTSAVIRLARFVVGLGAAARAETEALRHAVRELGRGAVEANGEG